MKEEILEPNLPIIDPHHHLWDLTPLLNAFPEPQHPFIASIARTPYYTFDQLRADTQCGPQRVFGRISGRFCGIAPTDQR